MLIGRLTSDVEVITTKNGKKVANITLAINRPFLNPKTDTVDTDFIDVSIWDELCDIAATYIKKGTLVSVKGRLTSQSVTLEGGAHVNRIQVIGERVIFLSSNDKKKIQEIMED